MLSATERHRIVVEWNRTAAPYPQVSAAAQVEAQAARTPESPAVTFGTTTLAYDELVDRAGRLARRLVADGVGPDVLVGVCLERSAELAVALLAIARAGGAYVPLDPRFPRARLAFMLTDCGAPVVVTQSSLVDALPATGARLVCIDGDRDEGDSATGDLPAGSGPDDLAYVIYTSGSTGRPKGVEVRNRGLVNLLAAMADRPGMGPADVMVAATTLSFDMAVPELWLPLTAGARTVVVPRAVASDPDRLSRLLDEVGATVMQGTPATWRLLLEGGWTGRPGFKAICGGEALPAGLVGELLDRGVELWNLYGPTETTVWSTAARVTARGTPRSIGRPLANTTLYILDADRTPVAVGVPGELYIGGAGVARGYLGDPGLTAERFVPDPFDPSPGARLYRTGDLARWRPDGEVDFLGRLDHQVKVRGFRIECGEVEAALEAQPGVQTAVVVAREDVPGDARLVAYVVAGADAAGPLREALRSSLPEYMVPSAFVVMDALPLTPTGKVDRRALPAPTRLDRAAPAPRTATEEVVAAVWADVLGAGDLGRHDDFFELGGHSLLAVRVVSRVRDLLGVDVPVRAVFDARTVTGLAGAIDDLGGPGGVPRLVALAGEEAVDPPLALAQEPLWFLDQLVPGNPFYNLPSAYRLAGPLRVEALAQALQDLLARHPALRTTFPAVGGRPHQRVGRPEAITLAVDDVSGEGHARRLARAEAAAPFDLAAGPVFRARLLRLGADEHVLLLTAHHIVSDAWSTAVVWRDLAALYGARCGGAPSPLPDLPLAYADFAVWQRRWVDGGVLAALLDHWAARLAGPGAAGELLTDRPRPVVSTYEGGVERFAMPGDVVDGLRALGRPHGATLYMGLLAVLKVVLARWTGSDDVVVGGTTAGRNRTALDDVVGLFVNPLALRTDLSGDPPFAEVVSRVRRTVLDALDHQDAPFDRVVARVKPPRDLSRNPLFQVAFELWEGDAGPSDVGGVTWTDVGGPSGAEYGAVDGGAVAARLDVELFVRSAAEGSLDASLVYATDLFGPATMARFAAHYRRVLDAVVADPALRLSELPLP